jgi:hypothetical protein
VPRWLKFGRALECTDIEMRFGRQPRTFAGQSRSAPGAKPAPRPSGRRIELRYLTFSDRIGCVFECYKNRNRCTAVLAATLTMAPIHSFWLTSRNKTDSAAQATTFESLGCATHNLILSSKLARRLEDITFQTGAPKTRRGDSPLARRDVSMFILLHDYRNRSGQTRVFNSILQSRNAGHRWGASTC